VIPPLRDRPQDIPLLADSILRRMEQRYGWSALALSAEALSALQERPWPGNVRQLENALARAALAARGRTILPEHLDVDDPMDPLIQATCESGESLPLRALLAEVERRAIQRALIACDGNRTRTAERLGISRRLRPSNLASVPRHGGRPGESRSSLADRSVGKDAWSC
jgi:DNA-binding NtrC family response regulator